jgi:hypothetical protein
MRSLLRALRWVVAMALASSVSIVPACGTMGGGGMHYLTDPAPASANATV